MKQLNDIGAEVVEYSGIKSNPLITDVDKAAELGRRNQVDLILALGGGSVLDSAKVTAMTIPVEHTGWKFLEGEAVPKTGIPIISVLTLAATGSEMNMFAVVQNEDTQEKKSVGSAFSYPTESFMDPTYTKSVPRNYTGYGITDLVAHSLEAYFGAGNSSLADRFIFSIISEALLYGPQLINKLDNYELRAKIMLAATYALNGTSVIGKSGGDWGVHALGHSLSVLYDVPHGASLSIVYPAWMKFHLEKLNDRISELGENIFNEPNAEECVAKLESFFSSVDSPVNLSEINIGRDSKEEILANWRKNKAGGQYYKFSDEDYVKLFGLML
ncbi:MAG: iron-containing alcohol dehydrogenase [Bacteroidota bacterium]|nr:iron-containing alcohol dehydrogenase [Bacteroidota bacterium]